MFSIFRSTGNTLVINRHMCFLIFLLAVLWPYFEFPGFAAQNKGEKFFISIGINHLHPSWIRQGVLPLKYAIQDAKQMAEHFAALGWQSELLPDARLEEFNRLLEKLSSRNFKPEDQLIIYISSHGAQKVFRGKIIKYLLMSDSEYEHLEDTAVDISRVSKALYHINARARASVIDACNTGSLQNPEKDRFKGFLDGGVEAYIAISSSSHRGIARESDELKGSVFTHFLLNAFRDTSSPDQTLLGAYQTAAKQTIEMSKGEQIPNISMNVNGVAKIFVNHHVSGHSSCTGYWLNEPGRARKRVFLDSVRVNEDKNQEKVQSVVFKSGGVKRLEVFNERNKLLLSRLIRLQDGEDHLLNHYMHETGALSLTAGWIRLWSPEQGFNGCKFGLSYAKNGLNYHLGFSTYSGRSLMEISRRVFVIGRRICTGQAGISYDYPLANVRYLEPSISFQWSAEYLYETGKYPGFYFEKNTRQYFPGTGAGLALKVRSGRFELGITAAGSYYTNFSESYVSHRTVSVFGGFFP